MYSNLVLRQLTKYEHKISAAKVCVCDCWQLIYCHAWCTWHSNCNLHSVVNMVCTALSNDTATDRQWFCTAVCNVHCWTFAIVLWMWDSGVCSQTDCCILYQHSMLSSLESWSICLLFLAVCLMLSHCQLSSQQWLNLKLHCKNKNWN